MSSCDHWDGSAHCGRPDTRHYLTGIRCPAHTPAAIAGHPEPGQTATTVGPRAQTPQSDSRVNDDRAIASGKRRSNPARFREAQARVGGA
jgi:hypothetical protein